jgi:hypothetical protein
MKLSQEESRKKMSYLNDNFKPKLAALPIALFLFLPTTSTVGAAQSIISIPDTIPAGFESIAELDQFHDIYFNNTYVSTVEVDIADTSLNKSLRDQRVIAVAQNYVSTFDHAVSLIDLYEAGELSVFYNKAQKNIKIYSTTKEKQISNKAGFSWKSEVLGSTSFNFSNSENDHVVNFINTLSFNDKSIKSSVSKRNEEFGINTFAYSHEAGNDRALYGVFEPVYNTYTRLGFNSVAGFEYQLGALSRETSSAREPITLTLLRDAIVRVERNNSLLKVVKLTSGENVITTNELPGGDYSVDLIISYYNGDIETQTAIVESSHSNGVSNGFSGLLIGYKNN